MRKHLSHRFIFKSFDDQAPAEVLLTSDEFKTYEFWTDIKNWT